MEHPTSLVGRGVVLGDPGASIILALIPNYPRRRAGDIFAVALYGSFLLAAGVVQAARVLLPGFELLKQNKARGARVLAFIGFIGTSFLVGLIVNLVSR